LTTGAAESVDPVTSTFPVAPLKLHSAAPGADGAAVGQELAEAAEVAVDGGLAEEVSVWDPHPAKAKDTAPAAARADARFTRIGQRYIAAIALPGDGRTRRRKR
jgi:hypothetical protein